MKSKYDFKCLVLKICNWVDFWLIFVLKNTLKCTKKWQKANEQKTVREEPADTWKFMERMLWNGL